MLYLLLAASFILSCVYMHIESVIYGLSKRKWTLAAIMFGPLLLPMFEMSKQMAVRKVSGFDNVYFNA